MLVSDPLLWCLLLFSSLLSFSAECSAATGANVKESCINLVAKIHQNNQTEMTTPVEKQQGQTRRKRGQLMGVSCAALRGVDVGADLS